MDFNEHFRKYNNIGTWYKPYGDYELFIWVDRYANPNDFSPFEMAVFKVNGSGSLLNKAEYISLGYERYLAHLSPICGHFLRLPRAGVEEMILLLNEKTNYFVIHRYDI